MQYKMQTLLHFVQLLTLELLQSCNYCSCIVLYVSDAKLHLVAVDLALKDAGTCVLFASDSLTPGPSAFQLSKFQHFCAIVLHNVRDISSFLRVHTEKFGTDAENWPKSRYPGSPHHYVLVMETAVGASTEEAQINNDLVEVRSKFLPMMENLFIVVTTQQIELLSAFVISPSGDKSKLQTNAPATLLKYNRLKVDMKCSPLVAQICATCEQSLNYFNKTSTWTNFMAGLAYEVAIAVNATLQLEPVYSFQREKRSELEEWDDFIEPLLDGTAHMSLMVRRSIFNDHVAHHTVPTMYDRGCFITAKPEPRGHNMVGLLRPLKVEVGVGFAVSFFVLFVTLEVIALWNRRRVLCEAVREFGIPSTRLINRTERWLFSRRVGLRQRSCGFTIFTLLCAAVSQNIPTRDLVSRQKNQRTPVIDFESCYRLLLGLWMLVSLVLCLAYNSGMTSKVTLNPPRQVPGTFAELAVSSFGSDQMSIDFESLNNSFSDVIHQRVVEHNYFEPTCYTIIFDGDNACLGYSEVFNTWALSVLVDTKGRPRYSVSRESLFPITLNFAISKFNPSLLGPTNRIIRSLQSTGVVEKWRQNTRARHAQDGKRIARWLEKEGLHGVVYRKGSDEDENHSGFAVVLGEMLFASFAFCLLCFVCETAVAWKTKNNLHVSGIVVSRWSTAVASAVSSSGLLGYTK